MITTDRPILVTGGSGAQGGAVIDALLAADRKVRALVRNPDSSAARALAGRGVALAIGDFDDAESLKAATQGVAGVFSVQLPPSPDDPESEVRTGTKLVDAAIATGVASFVHTSVARAGEQDTFVGWSEDRWWRGYWDSKSAVNEVVKTAGFAYYTIVKPAFMMDNWASPKAESMFPNLIHGRIETAMAADVPLDLIAASDVGAFAAAAFLDPERFHRAEIALAAEALTMTQVADVLSAVTGKTVQTHTMAPDEAIQAGNHPGHVQSEQWASIEGYRVDLAAARSWGIPLMGFADWAVANRDRIIIREAR